MECEQSRKKQDLEEMNRNLYFFVSLPVIGMLPLCLHPLWL